MENHFSLWDWRKKTESPPPRGSQEGGGNELVPQGGYRGPSANFLEFLGNVPSFLAEKVPDVAWKGEWRGEKGGVRPTTSSETRRPGRAD